MQNFKIYTRGVILCNEGKDVLLLKKNNEQKIAPGAWVLPGGTVEYGEDIEATLVREVKEETNLEVVGMQILTTKTMMLQDTHWLGIYYCVTVKSMGQLENAEPDKHEEVTSFSLRELPEFEDHTVVSSLTKQV